VPCSKKVEIGLKLLLECQRTFEYYLGKCSGSITYWIKVFKHTLWGIFH
jgi:hypothetical protein